MLNEACRPRLLISFSISNSTETARLIDLSSLPFIGQVASHIDDQNSALSMESSTKVMLHETIIRYFVRARIRGLFVCAWAFFWSCNMAQATSIPTYGFKIVHRYTHDLLAYTEGLFYEGGYLYESTGLAGQSYVRKVELETGKVLQQVSLGSAYFGEGIVAWHEKLIQVTWQGGVGFVYDMKGFKTLRQISYPGEGWALTRDSKHIYMSDGTADVRILDPDTLTKTASIHVTDNGVPVRNLNELEWVKGEIYANVWLTDRIARINPMTGDVVGWIDLRGLFDHQSLADPNDDVLNGIAYD